MNENEKTILVAVESKSKKAWLLSYTLEDLKELIDLSRCLLDEEDVPQDLKIDFARTLDLLKLNDTDDRGPFSIVQGKL